jgi:hypothetical protein
MKLKLKQVQTLAQALGALDGRKRIEEIDGKKQAIFEPFAYSAKFTWNRVKNLGILTRKAADIELLRVEIALKHRGKATNAEVPELNRPAYFAELEAALALEEELPGLLRGTREDLNLYDPENNPTGNRLTAAQILAVEALIDLDEKPAKAAKK